MTTILKFRDLAHGEKFEFEHVPFSGMETGPWIKITGPWIKITSRKYMADSMDHRLYGLELQVCSINAKVDALDRS